MLKYRVVLLFAIFLLIKPDLIAQTEMLDSLKAELAFSAKDTSRVKLLIELSKQNLGTSHENAINYGLDAQALSEDIDYTEGKALALKYIGMSYYYQAKYLETIQYWQQSQVIFEAIGNTAGAANMISNIGAIYSNQGDDIRAMDYYLKALNLAEAINDSLRIATVLNNIGGIYFNKESTREKSIDYHLRSYNISILIKDQMAIGTSAANVGVYYLLNKNANSALFYFNKSLEALEQTTNGNISYTLNFIGEAYALKNEFIQAKQFQNEALAIARDNNSGMDITMALIALGNTNQKEENYRAAIEYYKQAEVLAREIGVNYQLKEAFNALALSFSEISNYKEAFRYQKLLTNIKDTLYNAENDKKIQRLQFNYDLDKKQSEVDILTKDKELQALEVRRQKAVKNAFFLGLIFIMIIAYILYRNMRNKVKINKVLDKQKVEIEKLLLNILPEKVAEELQVAGQATPRDYESATVLFTDFKGFSKIAESLTPSELVSELNEFFIVFDQISDRHDLEKIKTIGDAYMCAGGIPTANTSHPLDAVQAGLEMQAFMESNNIKREAAGKPPWYLRVGIHTGPIVAGVVGKKKYAYDIWGNTVNISSRMESNGEVGKINISSSTFEQVKHKFHCEYRGKIYAKNIGEIDMYFVGDEIETNNK